MPAEPQNPAIYVSELHKVHCPSHLEALKLRNTRSGFCHAPYRLAWRGLLSSLTQGLESFSRLPSVKISYLNIEITFKEDKMNTNV